MRLLLVEDYVPLSNVLADSLTRSSFAVDQAFSAKEALQMAKAATHGLVLDGIWFASQNGTGSHQRSRQWFDIG